MYVCIEYLLLGQVVCMYAVKLYVLCMYVCMYAITI